MYKHTPKPIFLLVTLVNTRDFTVFIHNEIWVISSTVPMCCGQKRNTYQWAYVRASLQQLQKNFESGLVKVLNCYKTFLDPSFAIKNKQKFESNKDFILTFLKFFCSCCWLALIKWFPNRLIIFKRCLWCRPIDVISSQAKFQ